MIEKHKLGAHNDFNALKSRVEGGGQRFKEKLFSIHGINGTNNIHGTITGTITGDDFVNIEGPILGSKKRGGVAPTTVKG
jgi:hypothetical protein